MFVVCVRLCGFLLVWLVVCGCVAGVGFCVCVGVMALRVCVCCLVV